MSAPHIDPPGFGPHRHEIRVYFEDTDAGGIVYHANYLRFAERARTEMLRVNGLDHPTLLARYGGTFAVRRCRLDFIRPARLDDLLSVTTRVERAGGARLTMAQGIAHAGVELARIEVELAFLDAGLRPLRLPAPLRAPATAPP